MFDIDDILYDSDGKNPYGLHDDFGNPLSEKETITYFNDIDLTDFELYLLNEYILEDKSHTFYDNPWLHYNKNGKPSNFVEYLRYKNDLINKRLSISTSFIIHIDDEPLMVKIKRISKFEGYAGFCIVYNQHRFYTFAGLTDNGLWICFPYHHKAAELICIDDVECNKNKLFELFGNMKSAVVIAQSIVKLKNIIFRSSISNL